MLTKSTQAPSQLPAALPIPRARCKRVMRAGPVFLAAALTHPAFAAALAPVTNSSTLFRDTMVGISLAVMTGCWSYAGIKIGLAGASVRDMAGPFIGGTVSLAAAAMAAAFVG